MALPPATKFLPKNLKEICMLFGKAGVDWMTILKSILETLSI
jgi:hypothetical protein